MSSPSSSKRRQDVDVMALIKSKYDIQLLKGLSEFSVKFHGPSGTPYEGGVWNIRVVLPEEYPFISPSIEFINKIFHPNIHEESGIVCINVINQAWTALYDLSNIFDAFIPQLLTYPNPTDPLNPEAATLFLTEPLQYNTKVQEYIKLYATEECLTSDKEQGQQRLSPDKESSVSDFSEDETDVTKL